MTEPFPTSLSGPALVHTWDAAWSFLHRPAPTRLWPRLEEGWSEPQRHYHDRRHLGECMALWSRWSGHCEHPGEVGIALWFHDAVYDPQGTENEVKSAAWAARSVSEAGLGSEIAQRVFELVMATCHGEPVEGPDAAMVVDIDLAILGSPADRFQQYDRDIRKEYEWVPGFLYRTKRAAVLEGLARRDPLYRVEVARELLENQARTNLLGAISRLSE